jgi:ribonuclease HI
MKSTLVAYTDGSSKPNPGIGGWGWIIYENFKDENVSPIMWTSCGGKDYSTNQQMEMTAMAEFLESCPSGEVIDIYTDSKYVLNDIIGGLPTELTLVKSPPQGRLSRNRKNDWIHVKNYKSSYWKNPGLPNGQEIFRVDQALLKHSKSGSTLRFCWVKGHSKVKGNEKADELANEYARTKKNI